MKGFYNLVHLLSVFGVIISLIICMFIPPVGIILLIVNICAMSSASKEIKNIEDNGGK